MIAMALAGSAAISGIGLGPLDKSGFTPTAAKAFYLTVSNPSRDSAEFVVSPIGANDEFRNQRVMVFPQKLRIAASKSRRILAIVRELDPGETYRFRVCAEPSATTKEIVHARVCSKLSARRVGASGATGAR